MFGDFRLHPGIQRQFLVADEHFGAALQETVRGALYEELGSNHDAHALANTVERQCDFGANLPGLVVELLLVKRALFAFGLLLAASKSERNLLSKDEESSFGGLALLLPLVCVLSLFDS